MAGQADKVQESISWTLRLLVSLILPAWGIALLAIGINYGSAWWFLSGLAIGVTGALIFIGGIAVPLFNYRVGQR